MPAVFTFSEVGGHAQNEDSFGGRPHPDDEQTLVCAVADGMGGQPNGGPAARLAVRAALDGATNLPVDAIHWPDVLRQADAAVLADPGAGLTTLLGFTVREGRIRGASCGDSAVFILDAEGRAAELTARQRKIPPVGSGEAFFVPFTATLEAPWVLIAMTDGVWKYVGWRRIQEAAARHRGDELIRALQTLARLPGSGQFQDDFTLIVVQDRG
ncbi:MAG: SpoIIE family protein phosphatase [Gemmataceae bacterium]